MTHPALAASIDTLIKEKLGPQKHKPGTVCMTCGGTGSIVTRMAVIDGCGFPDEDMCMTCWGRGYVKAARPSRIPESHPTAAD